MKQHVVTVGSVESWFPSKKAALAACRALRAQGVVAFVYSAEDYRTYIRPVAAQ